jgi:hypothetical protein
MAKVGRPTKYKPEYCQKLIDYFVNWEPFYESPVEKQAKDGTCTTRMEKIPNPPPFLTKFAREELNTTRDMMWGWGKKFPEFSNALKIAKERFEEILIQNGLMGKYSTPFAIFTAKNTIGWRDKIESDLTLRPKPVIIKNNDGAEMFTLDLEEKK